MVDNGALTDYAVLVDDVVDATLGTGAKQLVGIADGTIGGTNKAIVSAAGALKVDGSAVTQPVSDAGGTLSVDDGAGSLTVDGTVGVSGTVAVDSELTTADLDTGAGTDTRAVVGVVGSAAGGGQLIGGDAANGLDVDVTRLPSLPAGANNIGDVDVLTVPAPLSTQGGGLEATALRVTVASDSTGVLSVDDNGGLLSVDDGGGSLTVDGTVTADLTGDLSDLDSGAGVDSHEVVAIGLPASGGHVVGGTATNPLRTDPTGTTVQPVSDGAGSLTVDNAGTFAVQDSEKVADNAAFTDGTTKVQPAGYIFDEVAGTALTENDAAAARIDSKRSQVAVIEDATTRGQRAAVSATGRLAVEAEVLSGTLAGLTVKRAFANVAASSTDSSIVAAVASKKIRVLAVAVVAGGTATNITFNSKPAGAGTAISPLFANAANGGEILPFMQHGWFETTAGEGLTVTTGAGSTTGVLVIYVEV